MARDRAYEQVQTDVKKILSIANKVLIILFSFFGALLLLFNGFMLLTKATSNSQKSEEYSYFAGNYFVCVTSNAWEVYYPKHSFLVAHDDNVNYDYFMLGEEINSSNDDKMIHEKRMNAVYLVKMDDTLEPTYVVGKIESKVEDGVVISGGIYVPYENVLGVVIVSVPALALLQNIVFILTYLLLLVIYVATLIIFSYTDIGFDMLFEKQFKGQIKKNSAFAFQEKQKAKEENEVLKTNEQKVHDLIIGIISDSEGKKQNKKIPLKNIENALKVVNEQNFTSKEKIFVFLSALNLLNAYVKSEDCVEFLKNKYFFKKYVQIISDYVLEKQSDDVRIFTDGSAILLECLGMQFSFHGVKLSHEVVQKEWSGVRLQPYANTIFELLYKAEFGEYVFREPKENLKKYLELIKKEK